MKLKAFLILLAGCALPAAAKTTSTKPNVLVVVVDDLGWADIGANGSTFHETPNIDQLAKSGVNFTQSYSACTVCSPTRASLLTGRAPQRVGITQWIHQPSTIHLRKEEVTFAEVFQEFGYRTGYIGKWHLGQEEDQLPTSNGFDWMQCVNRAGQPGSYFFPYGADKKTKGVNYWGVPDLEDGKAGDYLTDQVTTKAIDFMKEAKEVPFLLYLNYYTVHTPIQAPKKLVEKYQKKRKKIFGDSPTPTSEQRYGTHSRERQDSPKYAAMVEMLDTNIGRLINHLEESNVLENTLVVFTSDNGGMAHQRSKGVTSNRPLRSGKGWNYEGGIRIPTIYYWKGKLVTHSSPVPTISMDLFPTLLDVTKQELQPTTHMDGQSIKSALMNKPKDELKERFLAWTYPHNHGSGHKPSSAIRLKNWKLMCFDSGEKYELYDLENDLGESKNLAEQKPEIVKRLDGLLQDWIDESTDKANANYKTK